MSYFTICRHFKIILLILILKKFNYIDTLHLSPLIFPQKPYHKLIKDEKLQSDQINKIDFDNLIVKHPVELAYALAIINVKTSQSSTPPWVLRQYPQTAYLMNILCNKTCLEGCLFCDKALDQFIALKCWN